MPFEFFDHTGDIGIDLASPHEAGLFEAAAAALTETLTEGLAVDRRARVSVRLAAGELDLLLVDWLSELVYRFDTFQWLTRQATVHVAYASGMWSLDGLLDGETRDAARHTLKVLVKAVTYHDLHVTKTDEGWRARVVLDI